MNTKNKWYLSTWFIALLCSCWFFIFPPIIGIILLIIKFINDKKQQEQYDQTYSQNSQLLQENANLKRAYDELGVTEYLETKQKLNRWRKILHLKLAI